MARPKATPGQRSVARKAKPCSRLHWVAALLVGAELACFPAAVGEASAHWGVSAPVPSPPSLVWSWNDTEFPRCLSDLERCTHVVDGPMTANGDFGVSLGGRVGEGLVLALGKNDFWGFPGILLWHSSFDHFTPGALYISLVGSESGGGGVLGAANLTFRASQRLADGVLDAGYRTRNGRYTVRLSDVQVASESNVVMGDLEVSCPAGQTDVALNLTLVESPGGTNPYGLPVSRGQDTEAALLWHTKSNAPNHRLPPLLLNCSDSLFVYNSMRNFRLDGGGRLRAHNETAEFCLDLEEGPSSSQGVDQPRVVTVPCATARSVFSFEATTGKVRIEGGAVDESASAGSFCLGARFTGNTSCPRPDLDPASKPPCRSAVASVAVVQCDSSNPTAMGTVVASSQWRHDSSTGFLSVSFRTNNGTLSLCLAAIPPLPSNNVSVVAGIAPATTAGVVSEGTIFPRIMCNESVRIAVAAATERDAHGGSPRSLAQAWVDGALSDDGPKNRSQLRAETTEWWHEWWSKSSLRLDDSLKALQGWYETMFYLLRASTKQGAVAPALWGPFSVTDQPGWGDEMTLDYNFEANMWSAATANHPEVILPYASTILSLLPLSQQRASWPDWSAGGWPDMFGGEAMGMSCGPTPDWDHDFGCEPGFGGFDGIEMMSACGPFEGMAIYMDDGTRFVAGLAATPLVQYYDATQNHTFLIQHLVPYLVGVVDFYASYARWEPDSSAPGGRRQVFPYTCAQETCNGYNKSRGPTQNAHQDISYANMALSKLLQYTDPALPHGASASNATRERWRHLLVTLPRLPMQVDPDTNETMFADSAVAGGGFPPPDSNDGYGIAHLAAVFPANVVGIGSSDDLLRTARSTVERINGDMKWESGGGFCQMWPQASRAAGYDSAFAEELLQHYTHAVLDTSHPNGYTETGGGGLEMIGGADGIHALLLQTSRRFAGSPDEGVLLLFPAWPKGRPVSFTTLRADGGFLVSAQYNGTTVESPVFIEIDVRGQAPVQQGPPRRLSFANPFEPGSDPCVFRVDGGRTKVSTVSRNIPSVQGRVVTFPVKSDTGGAQLYTIERCQAR